MGLIYPEETDNQGGIKDMALAGLKFSHLEMLNPFHLKY